MRPFAWDGSGHFTLARIYSNTIFPDTFGWTNAFFGGMPHPNNYPPLFYWLIALLEHSYLFSFLTSFKIVLTLPTLLLPAATWFLAWKVSNRNQWIAFCSALVMTPILVDYRFFTSAGPLGISYISTFLTGLYSHPLGYLFLILWYAVYSEREQPLWRIALSAFLLAGAVLSNFFGAIFAGIFIAVILIYDLWRIRFVQDTENWKQAPLSFMGHLVSPIIAGCLTLFWLAPVFATREFLITQPSDVPFGEMISPALLVWYVFAGTGVILWFRRRQSASMGVYLATCAVLTAIVFWSGIIAPRWFPLNTARMFATLNFLLAVPVGLTFAFIFEKLAQLLGIDHLVSQISNKFAARTNQSNVKNNLAATLRQSPNVSLKSFQIVGIILAVIFGIIIIFKGIKPASFQLAFYPTENREAIDPLLNYAREHRDGRYLVEIPPFTDIAAGHEGRAINNFLPLQGNEVLTLFFREASPNIVFFSPIVDRFSIQADPSGISSVLSDDIDFADQSASLHIQQARLMGVRYLVIRSPWARNLLQGQSDVKSRRDFGMWSIYELNGDTVQPVRALDYKPALVVSDLNLKGRRHNDLDFVRFAEEQISSGWFDVILARSYELKLDKINIEDGFGALIVESYDYNDQQAAYDRLQEFAQNRQLVLLESDSPLFQQIQTSISNFPKATVINRSTEEPGDWLKSGAPSRNYETSQIRQIWRQIQTTLDHNKIAVAKSADFTITSQVSQSKITVNLTELRNKSVPIVFNTTYHPNWKRKDGTTIYPATPFFMLTFVEKPIQIEFARQTFDRIGLIISAATFLLLCVSLFWNYTKQMSERANSDNQNTTLITSKVNEVLDD